MNSQTLEHTTNSKSLKTIHLWISLALWIIITNTQNATAETLNISTERAVERFNKNKYVDLSQYLWFWYKIIQNQSKSLRNTVEYASTHKKEWGNLCWKINNIKTIYYSWEKEPAEFLGDAFDIIKKDYCQNLSDMKLDLNFSSSQFQQVVWVVMWSKSKKLWIRSKRDKWGINKKTCADWKNKVSYVTSTLERRWIKMKTKLRNLSHRKCDKSFMHIVQKAKECSNVLWVKQKDYVKYSQSCWYFSDTPMVFEHMIWYHMSAAMCGSDVKRSNSPIQGLNPWILVGKWWEQKKDNRLTKMCSHLSGDKWLNCLINRWKESYNKILITNEINDIQSALNETFGSPATCNVYNK